MPPISALGWDQKSWSGLPEPQSWKISFKKHGFRGHILVREKLMTNIRTEWKLEKGILECLHLYGLWTDCLQYVRVYFLYGLWTEWKFRTFSLIWVDTGYTRLFAMCKSVFSSMDYGLSENSEHLAWYGQARGQTSWRISCCMKSVFCPTNLP